MTPTIDITTAERTLLLNLTRQHLPGAVVRASGSRVKRTARTYSDLDLVVFAGREQRPAVSELKEALDESNQPFLVDLHVWDELPETFHEVIRSEHLVLHEGSEPNEGSLSSPDETGSPVGLNLR